MSFPVNPAKGDTYTSDDTLYLFNGTNWDRAIIGSNNSTNYAGAGDSGLLSRLAALEALSNDYLILD